MRAELEEFWMERGETRTVVRAASAGGPAFRTLRNARRRLSEVMQTAEDRYLEVYTGELEEFTKAGDMRG